MLTFLDASNISPSKARSLTKKKAYVDILTAEIPVPDGFIGPVTGALISLINHLNTLNDFHDNVLVPFNNSLALMLSKPDTLKSVRADNFKQIKDVNKSTKEFSKDISKYYNPKSTSDSQPYSRLYGSNGDYNG